MRVCYLMLLMALPFLGYTQIALPAASAPARVEQRVGYTDMSVTYSRPNVRGRVVFGELIPYGEVWRAGANEATLLRISRPVRIDSTEVAPGTYALYAIPGQKEWTLMVHADTTHWGANGYDASRDVVRLTVPRQHLYDRVETLEYRWMNVRPDGADLVLEWEHSRVRLPIAVPTNEQVAAVIQQTLTAKSKGDDYYQAARYYLDNDLDLAQAAQWMTTWLAKDGEQFGRLRYKALIDYARGDTAVAWAGMERSLVLARGAGNAHYVRMNEQSLREWKRTPVAMTAAAVLAKSIAYHDPKGVWDTTIHFMKLYEERPGNGFRLTDIMIDLQEPAFGMKQRRDEEVLQRQMVGEECAHQLNGRADLTDAQRSEHRLTCDFTRRMRDYYTYLWGLPMKLQDEGTLLHPQVYRRDFFGDDLLEVRVTYSPEVGGDIWYFYFDPTTYALRGYRFYHDEAANDGEYILLDGEAQVGDLRLPKRRAWYTHGDRRYLGSDVLLE